MRRRLSPDELRDVFTKCTAAMGRDWPDVDRLKDHVEALEGEIAELKTRLGDVEQQTMSERRRAEYADAKPLDQMRTGVFEAMDYGPRR